MKTPVTVRLVSTDDANDFVAAARRSRALHHPWTGAPANAAAFARYLAACDGQQNVGLVVCHAHSGALVGVINITNIVRGVFKSAYLGYYAFIDWQGQGLMKAGLRQAVRYAFTHLGLHRLEANIQPGNEASIGLARSCGFVREGYSPAYLKIGGRWRDHERWAIVRGARHALQPQASADD